MARLATTRLVLLASAAPAWAADVPGGSNTSSRITPGLTGLTGTFEFMGDKDWHKVGMTKGTDYACWAYSNNSYRMRLIKAWDKSVLREARAWPYGAGFEFRPGITADFFVETYLDDTTAQIPEEYHIGCMVDCRGDTQTKCIAKVGSAFNSRISYHDDKDVYRTALTKGVTYTVGVSNPCWMAGVSVKGPNNFFVASYETSQCGFSSDPSKVTFRAPETGSYYITAWNIDDGGFQYSFKMTSP